MNNKLLCMVFLAVFIAGCSDNSTISTKDNKQNYESRLTYYQWQNLPDNEKYIYVDQHIKKYGINIDADTGKTVEALNDIARDCDKECSETLMAEVISSLTTAYMLKAE